MVVQFGELDFTHEPNRTARYMMTARKAFEQIGIANPADHLIVAAYLTHSVGRPLDDHPEAHAVHAGRSRRGTRPRVPTVPARRQLVRAGAAAGPGHRARSSRRSTPRGAAAVAELTRARSARSPTTARSSGISSGSARCSRHIFTPLDAHNPEDVIGERVLLLLLAVAILFAGAVHARAVLLRAARVARVAVEGSVGRVLRRARSRLHVLRDHDDPAARAVPRLSHLLAHGDARVDPRVHRASAR